MPNPLSIITKPLQIGAQIASGAIQAVEGLMGRGEEKPWPREEPGREPPEAQRPPEPKRLDDATITAKAETILFRDAAVDKGKIDVNTVAGVVYLRGEAKTPEQIKSLEAQALEIPEVKRVENLLHLPKTPAQRKPRRTAGGTAAARKRAPKRTTSERKAPATANAEPTPKELASTGQGRQPAPLGSSNESGGEGGG